MALIPQIERLFSNNLQLDWIGGGLIDHLVVITEYQGVVQLQGE